MHIALHKTTFFDYLQSVSEVNPLLPVTAGGICCRCEESILSLINLYIVIKRCDILFVE